MNGYQFGSALKTGKRARRTGEKTPEEKFVGLFYFLQEIGRRSYSLELLLRVLSNKILISLKLLVIAPLILSEEVVGQLALETMLKCKMFFQG